MKITFKSVVQGFEHAIDTVTASSLLIHAIMIGAAVASYGNIESYLSAGHTNELTSMALAAVLGVSLVVAASRLTKLNLARLRTDKSLQTVVAIALATGVISGLLQALEYAKTYSGATPYLLGFGIPLLLEVAPAMTVALVKSIDANERTNTLRRDMADKITESIAAALDCISPDDMRKEVEQAAQLIGQLNTGGHQIVTAADEGTQGADLVALGRQGLEAMSVGAQQVGQQVSIGSIALGAVATIAWACGLDRVGMDGEDGEAGFHQRIDDEARRTLDGNGRRAGGDQVTPQFGQTAGGVIDVESLMDGSLRVNDANGVGLAGPVQPGEESSHGQSPINCGKTCRAGSPCGSLTDWRSWLCTLALHPVARLGLPAPRRLRVSCGPSSGQRAWQSPRGHGSRNQPSARQQRPVKDWIGSGVKHGLPTAAVGRFVASADRPPPWITLRHTSPTATEDWRVVQ